MPTTSPLSTTSKAIAWSALINGVLCLLSPFLLVLVFKASLTVDAALIYFLSAAVSLTASFFCLKRRQWAFWLLCAFFAVQLLEYRTESTYFSLVGPVSLKIGFIWNNPQAAISFNLFAVLVVVLTGRAALQILEEDNAAARPAAPSAQSEA